MAFHCGAPTRDGSPCQRHVRDLGTRCPQHRNLGGPVLRPPRHAMRTITLDPALAAAPTAWRTRDRVTPAHNEESPSAAAGTLADEEPMFYDAEPEDTADDGGTVPTTPEWLLRAAEGRERAVRDAVGAGKGAEGAASAPGRAEAEGAHEPEHAAEAAAAQPKPSSNGHAVDAEAPEPRIEQRPLLRKERALDPDWIGTRPLRDEAPRPPRIEFEPSDAALPRRTPRIAAMRSVVLNAGPEADPPTLIDRMPPIDPDDLVVPEFLRADFVAAAPQQKPEAAPPVERPTATERPPTADLPPTLGRPPLPTRQRRPRPAAPQTPAPPPPPAPKPAPAPVPDPDPPTLTDLQPVVVPEDIGVSDIGVPDIGVPDFVVPGFAIPAPKPPLRTVLSTVLGPELWERCYTEWSPAHCTALARIARAVDGLAPSAGTAMRSTAGAGMRWLGVAREREVLADQVADAISHPAGATAANQARTVRLYGAAICVALNVPLRRCACHRDLERDVSGELIRLGLAELAGEVS